MAVKHLVGLTAIMLNIYVIETAVKQIRWFSTSDDFARNAWPWSMTHNDC